MFLAGKYVQLEQILCFDSALSLKRSDLSRAQYVVTVSISKCSSQFKLSKFSKFDVQRTVQRDIFL